MVNTIYLFSFLETPRKMYYCRASIRKLESSSVLIINKVLIICEVDNIEGELEHLRSVLK